jgi:pyruvate kinase
LFGTDSVKKQSPKFFLLWIAKMKLSIALSAAASLLTLSAVPATAFTFTNTITSHAKTTSTVLKSSYLDSLSVGSSDAAVPIATQTDNFKSSQRWRKKTKQLATLGPASSSFEMIEKLFLAGADVFRLNFSHGEHAQKKELLDIIRQVEHKYDHPIAILGDLQGPKLRVGTFANPDGEKLQEGQIFRFDLDQSPGTNQRVMLPHPEIIEASEVGHVLLIDDGKVKVEVVGTGPGYLDCEVKVPGMIKDKKGVNTPDSILQISCLTPKDREDLTYMLDIGVDWVALSFVQRPEDIVEIKRLIMEHNPQNAFPPHVMAKIEKPSCFEGDSLKHIVDLCEGIMVARGDLGVECAPEDVPILQKIIVDECRAQGKPVVVATQMLESMIDSPTPTRAEASDAATAIYDGADAIMLSAESAAGQFPEESVFMQQRIINRVEGDPHYSTYLQSTRPKITDGSSASAIILAARQIARNVNAKTIVSFTVSGDTARKASKKRPEQPILAISPLKPTCRKLAMSWGVYPEYCPEEELDTDNFRDMLRVACAIGLRKGLVSDDKDLLVVTAGFPFGTPGAANIIRVIPAAGPSYWDATL